MRFFASLGAFVVLLFTANAFAVPAFPGAEGMGRNAEGGRGGLVFIVDSLEDYGATDTPIPGTLRYAVEDPDDLAEDFDDRRIVVFNTGGTITLERTLDVTKPYLTIAGQSAPGGGIQIRNGDFENTCLRVTASDVVIRHIRVRPGIDPAQTGYVDAITIVNQSQVISDIIIDHVSTSWGTDEVFDVGKNSTNVTVQWSIVAEGLDEGLPPGNQPDHSRGLLTQGPATDGVTLHHNLLVHNRARNPRLAAEGLIDVVNNVIYNWAARPSRIHDQETVLPDKALINLVGNIYIPGPNVDLTKTGWRRPKLDARKPLCGGEIQTNCCDTSDLENDADCPRYEVYLVGNLGPDRLDDDYDPQSEPYDESTFILVEWDPTPAFFPDPFVTSPHDVGTGNEVTDTDAATARTDVIGGAGATLPERDELDECLIDDVESHAYPSLSLSNKTNTQGAIIDNQEDEDCVTAGDLVPWPDLAENARGASYDTDEDGMADAWENTHFGNLNRTGRDDADDDGYTDVEEFLNGTFPILQAEFVSVASQDGYVVGNPATGLGINKAAGASDGKAIRAGDDSGNYHLVGMTSFDTSSLPDGAIPIRATLTLVAGLNQGNNSGFGSIVGDIRTGYFNGNSALENADYEAAATSTSVGTLSSGSMTLSQAGLDAINLQGGTQIRITFTPTQTNSDNDTDYRGFYSGDNATASNRPKLAIDYRLD